MKNLSRALILASVLLIQNFAAAEGKWIDPVQMEVYTHDGPGWGNGVKIRAEGKIYTLETQATPSTIEEKFTPRLKSVLEDAKKRSMMVYFDGPELERAWRYGDPFNDKLWNETFRYMNVSSIPIAGTTVSSTIAEDVAELKRQVAELQEQVKKLQESK